MVIRSAIRSPAFSVPMPPKYSTPSMLKLSGGRPSAGSRSAGHQPWNARLCTVMTLGGCGRPEIAEIGGQQPGLPVVGVDDVRLPVGDRALGDGGAGLAQGCESLGVVGPVVAGGGGVGSAVAVEQMRRIQAQHRQAFRRARPDAGRAAHEIGEAVDGFRLFQRRQHRAVAGDQRSDRDPVPGQRRGQGAHDVRQPAGLDQREHLGRDGENVHYLSASIIGCVIRQMPRSVRRKRAASSTGSSPTTSPSGMQTPRSITTFFNCAFRPISA